MRSLARAFAIRIQNISTLENVDAQPTLVFIACASNKNSNESAVSLHSKHLEDADTKSTSFFSTKAQTSRICAGWTESHIATQYNLIDLDMQLTLVFIAYASSGSADECVHMCSLARAFSTCV